MIATPAGWRRRTCGDAVVLTAIDDPDAGAIEYRERHAPLTTARRVVAARLAARSGLSTTALDDPVQVVTEEGEYGAWVAWRGHAAGQALAGFIGVVFGDEFVSLLDAVAAAERAAALERVTRELLLGVALGLGRRRRQFVYRPPPGWWPTTHALATSWYPPGFPRERASITVFPAIPGRIDDSFAARLSGAPATELASAGPVTTRRGLTGHAWKVAVRAEPSYRRELVILADERYTYPLRCEWAPEVTAAEPTFRELLHSAEPLPSAGGRPLVSPADVTFWIS